MSIQISFKILLADDDEDDRELFTEAAAIHNAEVVSVPNGMQLMKKLNESASLPDFILLDLNMPEKNGKECLTEIRQQERYDQLPVVIYSTSSSKNDIEDTYVMGANLYITKPNSYPELKTAIKKLLELDWSSAIETSRESFVYLG